MYLIKKGEIELEEKCGVCRRTEDEAREYIKELDPTVYESIKDDVTVMKYVQSSKHYNLKVPVCLSCRTVKNGNSMESIESDALYREHTEKTQ